MKNILVLCALLVFLSVDTLAAETVRIAEKEVEIPPPDGFALVTSEMQPLYKFNLKFVAPGNDQLGFYIPESAIPYAMAGEMPSYDRYYLLQIYKKNKDKTVNKKDFKEFKEAIKKDFDETMGNLKKEMPEMINAIEDGIKNEYSLDLALKINQIVPLEPHYETDKAISISSYFKYGVVVNGSKEYFITACTTTFLNVSGKLLFLYCYGAKEEVEWTRNASKTWVEKILRMNPQPSSTFLETYWTKPIGKAIAIVIIFGLIGIVRQRKKDMPKKTTID